MSIEYHPRGRRLGDVAVEEAELVEAVAGVAAEGHVGRGHLQLGRHHLADEGVILGTVKELDKSWVNTGWSDLF